MGNFTVYQDRLKKMLQIFAQHGNSECFSKISAIICEVNIVADQKQTHGNDFFVFYKFPLPPCSTVVRRPWVSEVTVAAKKLTSMAITSFVGDSFCWWFKFLSDLLVSNAKLNVKHPLLHNTTQQFQILTTCWPINNLVRNCFWSVTLPEPSPESFQ